MYSEPVPYLCNLCEGPYEPMHEGQFFCPSCIERAIERLFDRINNTEPDELETYAAIENDLEEHMSWIGEI